MKEHQITFLVDNVDASAHAALPLSRLAKKFKSAIHIVNITRNRSSDLSMAVSVLQAGLLEGDLCQITAIGIDAELACFVLKDVVAEHYLVIGSHCKNEFSDQLAQKIPMLAPQCATHCYYAKAQKELSKRECLTGLSQLICPRYPEQLLSAFLKREDNSSTGLTSGIALPHVMFKKVKHVSIAVIASERPIDWNSKLGNVHLAVGLVMPEKPEREQLIAATNLTRNLLNDHLNERLTLTRNGIEIQAILLYAATKLIG